MAFLDDFGFKFKFPTASKFATDVIGLIKEKILAEKNIFFRFLLQILFVGMFIITFLIGVVEFVVDILTGIALPFIAVGNAIGDLFNGTQDDNARNEVNSSTCAQINAKTDEELISMIRAMMSGFTGDADERAILNILICLPNNRVADIVNTIGKNNLKDEFQGMEEEVLMIRLQEAGVVGFSEWGDNTTRRFINHSDCSVLSSLSLEDVRHLIKNMFSGNCSDSDENAIIKLVKCLTCARFLELRNMPGMSLSEFDDNIDGAEWRRFKKVVEECKEELNNPPNPMI